MISLFLKFKFESFNCQNKKCSECGEYILLEHIFLKLFTIQKVEKEFIQFIFLFVICNLFNSIFISLFITIPFIIDIIDIIYFEKSYNSFIRYNKYIFKYYYL